MQRLTNLTLAPAVLSANAIALAQTPGGVGNLVLNGALVAGGVATMDVARRVGITSAGNDSARTFTITGTDRRGNAQVEALAGANIGLAGSLKDFLTVSNIAISGAAAGALTVGTTGVVSSQWIPVDRYNSEAVGLSVEVGAVAPTYTVETTLDDPFSAGVGVNPTTDIYLKPYAHPTLDAKNTSQQSAVTTPITAVRLTLTAFAANATAKFTVAPGFAGGR